MKKVMIIASLMMLFSCKKEEQVSETKITTDSLNVAIDSANTAATLNQINLESFGFPAEVNGCSCYFSKTKEDFHNEKYVYIDDYGNSAFLKIDGKQAKIKMEEGDFDPDNFSKIIKNDEFSVTIEGKKVNELDEVMLFQGTMTVENKKGEKTITPIYGECGC
ncbi:MULTISPECIES: hypothetical protein [unclassified Kaistella]|uniref:hypothetical protein n=1 Tax=unclassified Kaistella TaxID=2762626 RepID=UPI00273515EC|nr:MULTISPECIES: hypothetical protein [unclassified Kaistella]MDP2455050.1 hypothetical protein [Kaistella sp. SH11-4b]MDP2457958.1 hypothetical protein [Kaistella sp. SH40-3]MDP2460898.1 hypothetical protein [Kaistella sp. SH19-2b]